MEQNTGMSVSDWSSLVVMIVAICALVSPILTAACNNWHQRKMKQLEYEHQDKKWRLNREREMYEGYIRAAGAAVQAPTNENLKEYGSYSAIASYYAPKFVQINIRKMDELISLDGRLNEKVNLLNEVIESMKSIKYPQA